MHQDDEHVEQTEDRHRHDEEVDGDKVQDMVLEERSPGLRGWLSAAQHETRNGPLRNLEAELEQFTMNARRAQRGLACAMVRMRCAGSEPMGGAQALDAGVLSPGQFERAARME